MATERGKLFTQSGQCFEPRSYMITVEPLPEDEGGGWFATIPDLPGCMGDGETDAEAIRDVRLAALEWADAMIDTGRPIPDPSVRFNDVRRVVQEAAE